MTAILLSSLFVVSGIFAAASIVGSLRRYGGDMLALRQAQRNCAEWREVRIDRHEIIVRRRGAVILRPAFRARALRAPHALPAAA